jgi:heparinase II/III-like protein
MRNLFPKLGRIAQMSSTELWVRARERGRIEIDRMRFYAGRQVHHDAQLEAIALEFGGIKGYLEGLASQRFYPSATTAQRERTAEFVRRRFPQWLKHTTDAAKELRNHRVDLLGYRDLALGQEINWNRDPLSGYEWPSKFWATYDLNRSRVDPKVIHELNRHQHLPRLAKAYFLTGDEQYAEEAVLQMERWIDQAPPGCGMQWQSSLEIGIRAISWMWTVFLLLPSAAFDEFAARRVLESLLRQLDHVYRYPSVYTSPNTHLIGEAAALFMAGTLFPELSQATEWRRFGALTLINEMARQVTDEGVYREASTYYHCYAADFYLQLLVLARANRFQLPEWMWLRLEQMLEFVQRVTRPDGSLPLIGDDDGGRALALHGRDYCSYRDGLSCGAVLFGREDFKRTALSFAEETLWLLGPESFDVFESMDDRPSAVLHQFYAESGCLIQRSGSGTAASHLVFDCGGLGMLSGGHGHAAALSLTLFSDGKELLIDPATAVYNAAPKWRNFFRSTRAHNTVVVDGLDQSQTGGAFSWRSKAASRVISNCALPGMDYTEGEHDGYARLRQGVIHRRRLMFVRPNYWIVVDELNGSGDHRFDFLYHFAPGAELFVLDDERRGEVDCRVRCGSAALQLYMYGSAPVRTEAVCGESDPVQGWASSLYGQRVPSPVLTATVRGVAPVYAMTFLTPRPAACVSRRIEVARSRALAASFGSGEYEDACIFSADSEALNIQHYGMQGELFWMRTQDGQLKQLIGINALRFSVHGEIIFEHEAPIPYVVVHLWENGLVIERGGNEGKVYVRDLRYRQFQSH